MMNLCHWIDRRKPCQHLKVLAALLGVLLIVGFLCSQPEAVGFAASHTHLGQPHVGHCWASIASFPTLGFIPVVVALLSFTLTLQGRILCESPFKPPRAFPLSRR